MPASTSRQDPNGASTGYSIAKVAKLLEVSTSMLRKWERLGIVRPERGANGYRRFSAAEVDRLKEVQRLKTEKNVSSAAVVHLLRKDRPADRQANGNARAGLRLKRLREQRGSTLSDAADRAGISVSYLSCIERGHSNASVAVLQRLAMLYGTSVLSFFGETLPSQKLLHPKERRRLTTTPGITMEPLAIGHCTMEPHLFRVAPGASSRGAYSHEGEEFIFMLKGGFDIWLDGVEHYHLTAGDSLYFPSRQSYRWMNSGDGYVEMIWCGAVIL